MSKIVRVQTGDYKIVVGSDFSSGNIILDTNPLGETGSQGEVRITGDLVVLGNTTVVESETLTIRDNIIYINEGETGAGVTTLGNTSGVQIDRGQLSDVSILWDERIGSFVLVDADYVNPVDDLHTSALSLGVRSVITGGSNLTLVGSNLGSAGPLEGVVDVIGTVNYEEKIINYSLLNVSFEIIRVGRIGGTVEIELNSPHGLSLGDLIYVECFPLPQINTGTNPVQISNIVSSTVIQYVLPGLDINPPQSFFPGIGGIVRPISIRNDDYIPNMKAVVDYTAATLSTISPNKIVQGDSRVIVTDNSILDEFGNPQVSEIRFDIDSVNQAIINGNGLFVDNIQIDNNTIKNKNTSLDKILFDSVLELKTKPGDPGVEPGYVSLYSKPIPGTGGTGLYFVNTEGTRDELISKTKALLYSLIL
jgi:hypothetical protein